VSSPQEKVLDLVASGKITTAEADELIHAMSARPNPAWRWLFRPAERVGWGPALAAGAVAWAAQMALSRLGVRFDGSLDMHIGDVPSWSKAAADAFATWPFTAGVLWLCALIAGKSGRFIDMLGITGLARWPLTATGLLALAVGKDPRVSSPFQVALLVCMLPLFAWGVTLLVTGFNTATGLKGARRTVAVILGIVGAEILSRVLVAFAPG
jgi:hypothetical protein